MTDDLNSIWHSVVSDWYPKAEMLDSMEVLGDEEGKFRWNMKMLDGSMVPLRKEHGVHFFEVGADALSREFEEILEKDGWVENLWPVSESSFSIFSFSKEISSTRILTRFSIRESS